MEYPPTPKEEVTTKAASSSAHRGATGHARTTSNSSSFSQRTLDQDDGRQPLSKRNSTSSIAQTGRAVLAGGLRRIGSVTSMLEELARSFTGANKEISGSPAIPTETMMAEVQLARIHPDLDGLSYELTCYIEDAIYKLLQTKPDETHNFHITSTDRVITIMNNLLSKAEAYREIVERKKVETGITDWELDEYATPLRRTMEEVLQRGPRTPLRLDLLTEAGRKMRQAQLEDLVVEEQKLHVVLLSLEMAEGAETAMRALRENARLRTRNHASQLLAAHSTKTNITLEPMWSLYTGHPIAQAGPHERHFPGFYPRTIDEVFSLGPEDVAQLVSQLWFSQRPRMTPDEQRKQLLNMLGFLDA